MSDGATAFMRAARGGDVDPAHSLIEKGADPKPGAGQDGLPGAASGGGRELGPGSLRRTEPQALAAVKKCVELGLDVNALYRSWRNSAAWSVALCGANTIITYLVEKGA